MDIPIHADVNSTEGHVGKSTHIIVDLINEQVTHFVVKSKKPSGQYVVPLDKVKEASRELIVLDCTTEEVYQLPPFNEAQYNGYDDYDSAPPVPTYGAGSSSTLYHPHRQGGAGAAVTQARLRGLAINKGARVLATDGEVGKIDELVIDPETNRVTHLLLRKHHLLTNRIITIPVVEIRRAEMDAVYLKIDKEAVKELPQVSVKKFPWE